MAYHQSPFNYPVVSVLACALSDLQIKWYRHSRNMPFHILYTMAGIRPMGPGFSRLQIEPNLKPDEWLQTTVAHPAGMIQVDLGMDKELEGSIMITRRVKITGPGGKMKIQTIESPFSSAAGHP